MRIILFLKFLYRIIKYLLGSTKRYSFLLFSVFKTRPSSIIEIGVYNGNRAIELIETAKIFNKQVEYYGFDLFEEFYETKNRVKIELSKFPLSKKDIQNKLNKLAKIRLLKGDTKKTLPKFIRQKKKVDFIFIDGGHSVNTIKSDWNAIKKIISKKSLVIFDDYYEIKKNILNKYGCNNVITSLSAKAYKSKKFIIGDTFFDKFLNIKKKIYMVSVKKL